MHDHELARGGQQRPVGGIDDDRALLALTDVKQDRRDTAVMHEHDGDLGHKREALPLAGVHRPAVIGSRCGGRGGDRPRARRRAARPAHALSREGPSDPRSTTRVHKIDFGVDEHLLEIAPDRSMLAWTFTRPGEPGRIPGPVLRITEGDRVDFTFHNTGSLQHSMDIPRREDLVVAPP